MVVVVTVGGDGGVYAGSGITKVYLGQIIRRNLTNSKGVGWFIIDRIPQDFLHTSFADH